MVGKMSVVPDVQQGEEREVSRLELQDKLICLLKIFVVPSYIFCLVVPVAGQMLRGGGSLYVQRFICRHSLCSLLS